MKSTHCPSIKLGALLVILSLSIAPFYVIAADVPPTVNIDGDKINVYKPGELQGFQYSPDKDGQDCASSAQNLSAPIVVAVQDCARACFLNEKCQGFSFKSAAPVQCALKADCKTKIASKDAQGYKFYSRMIYLPPTANSFDTNNEPMENWQNPTTVAMPTVPQSMPFSAKMDLTSANRSTAFMQPYALYLNDAVVGRASYGIGCKAGSNGDYNCAAVNYDSCWIGTYNVNTKKWVKNWAKDFATCTGIDNDFTKSKAAIDATTIKAFDNQVKAAPAGYSRDSQGDCNGSDLGNGLLVANAAECAKSCSNYSGKNCLGFSLDTRLTSGKYRCVLKSIRGCAQKTDNLYQFFYKQIEVQTDVQLF
jgi:hypothetical protein